MKVAFNNKDEINKDTSLKIFLGIFYKNTLRQHKSNNKGCWCSIS